MRKKVPIEIKGNINGLYLAIDESIPFLELKNHLDEMLSKSADFYKGSSIIGCQGGLCSYKDKYEIESLIQGKYGIRVESLEPLQKITKPEQKVVEKEVVVEREVVVEKSVIKSDTQFVKGTMRSGKSIEYNGNVIVFGDVNPGAEIIATGNVVIIGKLLGFVHAGASGDDQAFVVANLFQPTQVRISKYISVPPKEDERSQTIHPEIATVSDGVIKIDKVH